jgi:transmembrane sensor
LSNVIQFSGGNKKARELASERAGEFLARLDAGASAEDLERIRLWLAEDPLHQEVFVELAALWDQMTVLSTLSEVFPLKEYARETKRVPMKAIWSLAAAASMVLVIGLVWLLRDPIVATTPVFPEPEGFVQQFHETKIGEQTTIMLPDNTEVILNTNTVIEVVYSEKGRNIFLTRGEGLFTVSKDPSRPFRVYAGNRMIEAVGTTFTVLHTQPDNVSVVVKEGRVNFLRLHAALAPQTLPDNVDEVLYRDENASLIAGESAASVGNQTSSVEKTQIHPDEIEVKLAWTHGMLLFQGDTLEEVLAEVSRYTTTKLEAEPAIRDMQVEGYFRAGDIDGLLVAMQKNFQIESEKLADDHIVLRAGIVR